MATRRRAVGVRPGLPTAAMAGILSRGAFLLRRNEGHACLGYRRALAEDEQNAGTGRHHAPCHSGKHRGHGSRARYELQTIAG